MSGILRVFPSRTRATPDDVRACVGFPTPANLAMEPEAIHISVTFSWDLPQAEILAEAWRKVAPVSMGGPALGHAGADFTPGLYLKSGYIITSRGCPNRCWFCSVWKREGSEVRELPIAQGWNVLDDNLLSCSETHVRAVFAMLRAQSHKAEFTGGFEAARLQPWHVELLAELKPKQVFFAYDTVDDLEPLREAGKLLRKAELIKPTSHMARCYVLIGYPKDTLDAAEQRLSETVKLGFMPMAMLWRGPKSTSKHRGWQKFQRVWANPILLARKMAEFT